MPSIIRSPQAESDLIEIAVYIAQENPKAASRWLDTIDDKLDMLSRQPLIGEIREEIAHTLQSFPAGNYVIFYQPFDDGVKLVRVLHGAGDLDQLF